MTRILSACMVLALAACAPKEDANGDGIVDGVRDPNSVSQIAPSNPVGTISGTVVNSLQQPLEGVQVTLVLGAGDTGSVFTANTNAQGTYSFKDLPGGSGAQLSFSKTGYSAARTSSAVPGNSGQFPINDGNGNVGVVTLAQLSASVKFRVYTADGAPARGARAFLEVSSTAFQTASGNYGSSIGSFSGNADVDEAGLLTFDNAPDPAELTRINRGSTYVVSIGAIDEDADGRVDVLGTISYFDADELFTNPDQTIILPRAGNVGSLQILATNLASFSTSGSAPYRNAVKGSEPITIVFNQPISPSGTTRLIKVVGEDCQTNVAVSTTQRTPNTLSISPTAPWSLGSRYNIIVRVTGLESGTTTDFIGYFFAIDPTAPRDLSTTGQFQVRKAMGATMNNAYQAGDTMYVQFDTPVADQFSNAAYAQVDVDLNGDTTVGGMNGFGELGGPSGFSIAIAEQNQATVPSNGTFICKTSGYSSRWRVVGLAVPASGSIAAATRMRVVFPKDNSSSDTYQTAWGSPVLSDVGGTISILP